MRWTHSSISLVYVDTFSPLPDGDSLYGSVCDVDEVWDPIVDEKLDISQLCEGILFPLCQ